MRNGMVNLLRAAVVSGLLAGATTAAAVAIRSRRESGSAIAPINATSHVAWGDEAAQVEHVDVKHSALGAAIHASAGVFWAALYEKLFGPRAERGDVAAALAGGAAVAALAYVVDYHVVPKRLTPGWERRVSARSLLMTYGVLAASLPLRALLRRRRRASNSSSVIRAPQ